MTLANCPAPTTAERIRSTCVRAGGALLAVEGAEPRPATPGATADRARGAAEHPNPALLQVQTPGSAPVADQTADDTRYLLARLEIKSVVVTDATGAEGVDAGTLLAACPDPFCAFESCWIRHLNTAHQDVVARLAARLPARPRRGDVCPLGVDRYAVRLRVESADGDDRDVRLPFHQPVDDVTGLVQAIRVLMGCPFANGLRARRD
jgi:hypothetical protein